MNLNYEETIKLLTSQGKFYINLGLERILSIMNLLGNPQENLKIIHIAGTNGKGSVSAVLSEILKSAGYKTGLYTSPHLVEYTERIQINNRQISKDEFSKYVSEICDLSEKHNIDLTEFEILTAAAFKYFYDNKVDIAIMETGMGGRFDATNICKNPILCIITSISKDHTDRLGANIEEIAFEKAGIIKENSEVIISPLNAGFEVIKKKSQACHARLVKSQNEINTVFEGRKNYAFLNFPRGKYEFSLLGLYQRKNLALIEQAVNVLKQKEFKVSNSAVKTALKNVKWPARLEYISEKNLVIDGAHNPDGALELKKSLDYYFKDEKRLFIYSTISTKDYVTSSNILFKPEDEIYFYEFNHKNAVMFEEYKSKMPQLKNLNKLNINKLDEILKKDCLKVVTGSLYMIGEIYNKLII